MSLFRIQNYRGLQLQIRQREASGFIPPHERITCGEKSSRGSGVYHHTKGFVRQRGHSQLFKQFFNN
jgi:hypothetical protein